MLDAAGRIASFGSEPGGERALGIDVHGAGTRTGLREGPDEIRAESGAPDGRNQRDEPDRDDPLSLLRPTDRCGRCRPEVAVSEPRHAQMA